MHETCPYNLLWISVDKHKATPHKPMVQTCNWGFTTCNASDHACQDWKAFRSMLAHPDQSIDWRPDKTSPIWSRRRLSILWAFNKTFNIWSRFSSNRGHQDWVYFPRKGCLEKVSIFVLAPLESHPFLPSKSPFFTYCTPFSLIKMENSKTRNRMLSW